MKVLFMISHPAHFHMFRYTIDNLQHDGHEVVVVIRPKDVLEQLCIDAKMPYYKVKNRPKKWGMFGLAIFLIEKIIEVLHIARKEKPDMLVGSDGVLAVVGKILRIPAFECYEDDGEAIALYAKMFFPIYTGLLGPQCCSAWKWESKKLGYPSYQELGYIHPNQFTANKEIVEKYGIDTSKTYFVIRFAQLTAHHDVGIHGMNTQIAEHVVNMLKPHGQIYITSERELEPQFEPYRIRINPLDMHHVMAFASLYIGDSQTMAAEAGVLGTPFVRFNDFVGRLSYLHELEAPTDYTPRKDGMYLLWINMCQMKFIIVLDMVIRQQMLRDSIIQLPNGLPYLIVKRSVRNAARKCSARRLTTPSSSHGSSKTILIVNSKPATTNRTMPFGHSLNNTYPRKNIIMIIFNCQKRR